MYPNAYIEYLVYFHGSRDYFECHEILEEHWKSESKKKRIWVGLIQLAVSLYHQRRGNREGALRMMDSALQIIESESLEWLSLNKELLLQIILNRLNDIQLDKPYQSFDLPIVSKDLISKCIDLCKEKGFIWRSDRTIVDDQIIHKHILRDRSDVINERNKQLQLKKGEREANK